MRAPTSAVSSRNAKWLLLLSFASIPFVVIFRKSLFVGSIVLRDAGRWSIRMGWKRRAPLLPSVRLPADSLQPGTHRPLLDGPDAVADQVYSQKRKEAIE